MLLRVITVVAPGARLPVQLKGVSAVASTYGVMVMAVMALAPLFITVIFGAMVELQATSTLAATATASLVSSSLPALTAWATRWLPSSWIKPTKAISSFFLQYEGIAQLMVMVWVWPMVQLPAIG